MKNNVKEITELLNSALQCEFTTINQYWIYGLTLHHIGLERLSKKFLEESVEERSHVERIASRILQIGGVAKFDAINEIDNTQDVEKMLECGIQLENDVIDKYNKMISKIADMQDHATADILTEILREEVIHKEWLEAQLKVMREMGRQLYISKLVELDEEEGSGGGKHHHH